MALAIEYHDRCVKGAQQDLLSEKECVLVQATWELTVSHSVRLGDGPLLGLTPVFT